jgi:conjugal transfer/entry exclusion protein
MQNLAEQLLNIENKVKAVLQKMEELSAENDVLKTKNNRLLNELDELKNTKSEQISPLVIDSSADGKYEEIKKELDHYIDEIDQTIELLKVS